MAEDEPVEFCGWVSKAAGDKWKQRYMVLAGGCLTAYTSEEKRMSLGNSRVSGSHLELVGHPDLFVFDLYHGETRSCYGVETASDLEGWLTHLERNHVVMGDTVIDPDKRPELPGPLSVDSSGGGDGTAFLDTLHAVAEGDGAAPGASPPAAPEPESAPAPPLPADRVELEAKCRELTSENLGKMFDFIDASGDGSISVCEWCSAIRKAKSGAAKLKKDLGLQLKLFNDIDADGSGEVDREEFVEGLTGTENEALQDWMAACLASLALGEPALETKPARPAQAIEPKKRFASPEDEAAMRERLARLYDIIDVNGDGDVTVTELLSSFRKYAGAGSLTSDLDRQLKLFASMDADGSGGLDKDEFVGAAVQVDSEEFTEWVDRVLYEDRIAANSEALAKIDAAVEEKAKQMSKAKMEVIDSSNPFFATRAASSPSSAAGTSSPAAASPSSAAAGGGGSSGAAGTPPVKSTISKSQRASMVLGRVAGNPLKSKRGRGRGRGRK